MPLMRTFWSALQMPWAPLAKQPRASTTANDTVLEVQVPPFSVPLPSEPVGGTGGVPALLIEITPGPLVGPVLAATSVVGAA
jgi:hypothetical protein